VEDRRRSIKENGRKMEGKGENEKEQLATLKQNPT